MRIRRLGWAGLELEAEGTTILVDPLVNHAPAEPILGPARTPLPEPREMGAAAAALVTHLHWDHADMDTIGRALAPDGVVVRPVPATGEAMETIGTLQAEQRLGELDLDTRVVEPWDTVDVGPFHVVALPAVDGFGEPQVAWAISAGDRRIGHFGDTIFHGYWWRMVMRHGPFDAVFLPVNGPVCDFPHRQPPSPLPAAMTPAEAALAAHLLQAGEAVPIHYDTIHHPPSYIQIDDAANQFVSECERLGVAARVVETGEVYELPQRVT